MSKERLIAVAPDQSGAVVGILSDMEVLAYYSWTAPYDSGKTLNTRNVLATGHVGWVKDDSGLLVRAYQPPQRSTGKNQEIEINCVFDADPDSPKPKFRLRDALGAFSISSYIHANGQSFQRMITISQPAEGEFVYSLTGANVFRPMTAGDLDEFSKFSVKIAGDYIDTYAGDDRYTAEL